jgi:nucleoside-triphosphatase THEP1
MILDYDHNPNITEEKRLQSLKESVQRALDELGSTNTTTQEIKQEVTKVINNTQTIVQTVGTPMSESEVDSVLSKVFDE